MQQTETCKLNLIETSDPFSPAPLNENAEKIEAALATKADARQAAAGHAALEQRLAELELHKVVAGFYIGDGEKAGDTQFIDLGFTPALVAMDRINPYHPGATFCMPGYSHMVIEIVPGGFKASVSQYVQQNSLSANSKGSRYHYIAIC